MLRSQRYGGQLLLRGTEIDVLCYSALARLSSIACKSGEEGIQTNDCAKTQPYIPYIWRSAAGRQDRNPKVGRRRSSISTYVLYVTIPPPTFGMHYVNHLVSDVPAAPATSCVYVYISLPSSTYCHLLHCPQFTTITCNVLNVQPFITTSSMYSHLWQHPQCALSHCLHYRHITISLPHNYQPHLLSSRTLLTQHLVSCLCLPVYSTQPTACPLLHSHC